MNVERPRAERGAPRRHIAAYVSHQRDQRGLAHEGRLTAHVRAGDQEQLALGAQRAVVGDELFDLRFHNRVPSLFDLDAATCRERGRDPVERASPLGESRQQIQFRERRGDPLAIGDEGQQCLQQRIVERAFTCECPLLGRQGFVFEGLQFRRDVALGVLQRLAPAIVVRHLVGLAARDFDIEAMHLVVFDAQIADAGTGPFACFEVDQELPTVF